MSSLIAISIWVISWFKMDNWSESSTGEYAAYYPIWYEYDSTSWGWTEEDIEWKTLLQERLTAHGDGYMDAKNFCMDVRHLREYPKLDGKGREASQIMS